jgi:hypothetical protein
MKVKYTKIGTCMICLKKPCQCKELEQSRQDDIQENTNSLEEKLTELDGDYPIGGSVERYDIERDEQD